KFDPIPQKDYYSLAAAYNGASWSVVAVSPPAVVARFNDWQKAGKEIEARIARWSEEQKAALLQPEMRMAGRYLLAAWKARVLRQREVKSVPGEKLKARFLARAIAWLATKRKPTPGILGDWLKAAAEAEARAKPERGDVAVPEALRQATDKLQQAVSA